MPSNSSPYCVIIISPASISAVRVQNLLKSLAWYYKFLLLGLVVLIAVIHQKRHKCYSIPSPIQVFGQNRQHINYRMMKESVWNVVNHLPFGIGGWIGTVPHFILIPARRFFKSKYKVQNRYLATFQKQVPFKGLYYTLDFIWIHSFICFISYRK